jgi:hypothetical protein
VAFGDGLGVGFTTGFLADVFWSFGFLVAFGAGFGVAFGFTECIAGFGDGLALDAAMAEPVIKNAAASIDAITLFMCTPPSQ